MRTSPSSRSSCSRAASSEPATYRSSPSVPPLMTSTRSPFFGRHAYPPGDASGTLRSSPRLSTPAVLPPMVTVPLSAFVVSCGSSVRRSQPATHIFSYLPQCQLRRLAACRERVQRLAHAERPPHAQPRERQFHACPFGSASTLPASVTVSSRASSALFSI